MSAPALPLSRAERAAVLIMIMEDEHAGEALRHLEPDELRQLGEAMMKLEEVKPEAVTEAVSAYLAHADRTGIVNLDQPVRVKELMTKALGDRKADSLMARITPPSRASSIDLVRWLEPAALVNLIRDEHPQLVAVLLTHCEPEAAAQVLQALPEDLQPQVVHRVATLGPVSAQAMAMLEAVLAKRITEKHGPAALEMGGISEAAAIINNATRAAEKRIMPALAKIDKTVAKGIESEMFKFEHLLALDDKSMGALVRSIEADQLVFALKGIEPEQRERFFGCMSARAADGIRDEIEERGRVKLSEVQAAQTAIVALAKRLAADGTIMLGSGDDDYV